MKSYFGKLGSPESLGECKEVVSNVFSKLDRFQKYCSITADEIHVKPSLQFQKDKVIGFAADIDYPCVAKTVLAIMINPSIRHLPAEQWWKLLYINLSSVQWLEVTANKTVSSVGNVRKAAHQCKRPML